MLGQLYGCFLSLDQQTVRFDAESEKIVRSSETCRRLARISGVGPKTATAIVAAVGNGAEFTNGQHLAT